MAIQCWDQECTAIKMNGFLSKKHLHILLTKKSIPEYLSRFKGPWYLEYLEYVTLKYGNIISEKFETF